MKITLFLILSVLGATAWAEDSWVEGLRCTEEVGLQEVVRNVEVVVNGKKASIVIPTSQGAVIVTAAKKELQPILDGDLDKMNGKIVEDSDSGAVISFRVSGADVSGKPRLDLETENGTLRDCNLWMNSKTVFP